jgi:hypothetical protein
MANTDEERDEQFEQVMDEIDAQEAKEQAEAGSTESSDGGTVSTDPSYPHLKIMLEKRIWKNELPEETQKLITTFVRYRRNAKLNPDNTDNDLKAQETSKVIAEKLMEYVKERDQAKGVSAQEEGGEVTPIPEEIEGGEQTETIIAEEGGAVEGAGGGESGGEKKEEKGGVFDNVLEGLWNW